MAVNLGSRRVMDAMRRTGHARLIVPTLPLTLLTLAGSAAGELVGYAVGGGEGSEGAREYELHRNRYTHDYDELSAAAPQPYAPGGESP